MARELQYQGLAELPVIIEDNSRYSSEYFQITKFPELLTAGKNLFRFKGSDKFIEESDVLIEVLDSNGQPIYYEADLDLESTEQSVIVSIYVDEETPPGSGEIILCGYIATTGSISYTEDDFQPNIRWRQPIDIDPSKQNVTEILFSALPNVLINTSSVVDNYTITNYQGNDLIKSASIYNFTYDYRNGNEPVIYGSVNTSDIATLDVLGGATFEVTRSKFSGNPRPDNNLTLTTQTLSASIVDYISTGSTIIFTVEYPFESSIQGSSQTHTFINGTGTTGSLYFEQTASTNSSENTYTIISASFNGLAPQVGNITKIRTFYKSVGVGEYVLASETDISDQTSEFGYTPDSASIIVPLPTVHRNDRFDLKFQFLNFADAVSKQILYVKDVGMPGGNVYIGGDDNLITGSVYVAGQTGTGVSIEGSTAGAFIRSVGYEGFQNVVANGATGQPGFIMYSGSVATMLNSTRTENYRGIGLELTAHSESYLRYTTSGSGLLDIRTNKFFLGSSRQYIVGADGLIQISSSNFFLSSSGDVIMAGTITATAGNIGGFTITSHSLSGNNFFISGAATSTGFFISASKFNVKGNGDVTGSNVLFTGGKIGSFTLSNDAFTAGSTFFISSSIGATPASAFFISSSRFNIKQDGTVTGSSALFSGSVSVVGTINALDGNIGGFAITRNAITGSGFFLSGSATGNEFFISSSKFNVKANGDVTGSQVLFTGGKIAGFTISNDTLSNATNFFISGSATGNDFFISSSKFNVKANGDISASSALFSGSVSITGNVNARTGNIGGFNITSDAITGSGFYLSGSATGNGFFISSSNFNVKASGDITGSNVLFTGGRIGSFALSNDALTAGSTFFISSSVSGTPSTAFFISSSKFNVRQDGTITGSNVLFNGGTVGGFTIDSSKITGTNIIIDSAGSIQTSNYASDLTGWKISAANNGFAEFENVKIRGTLSTAVFEKQSVNAVGGQLYVANSTTLTGSAEAGASTTGQYTATQTTMSVENVTGFEVGEIITAKKFSGTGFGTEYMRINSASRANTSSDTDFSGRIYVTRGLGSGTNGDSGSLGETPGAGQTYSGSQVIVSTGKLGTGFIRINANPNDQATPYIDIVERTGSGIYDVKLKARLGDLSGLANSSYVFGNSNPGFGLATDNVFLQGGIIANTGSIGGINMQSSKLFTGTGTFNNTNTGFYLDSSGQLSLKDKLSWDGTNLNIVGDITVTNPDDFSAPRAKTTYVTALIATGSYPSFASSTNPLFTQNGYNGAISSSVTGSDSISDISSSYDLYIIDYGYNAASAKAQLILDLFDAGYSVFSNGNDTTIANVTGSAGSEWPIIAAASIASSANWVSGSKATGIGGLPENDPIGIGWTDFYTASWTDSGVLPTRLKTDMKGASICVPLAISGSTQPDAVPGLNTTARYTAFYATNPRGGKWFHTNAYITRHIHPSASVKILDFLYRRDNAQEAYHNGFTKITGDMIQTGKIQSTNWTTGGSVGSQFNLNDGTFKLGGDASPKLSWNGSTLAVDGTVTANAGNIGGFAITANAITGSGFLLSGSATGDQFFISASNFNVKANGNVTGSNVLFNGGRIASFTLSNDALTAGSTFFISSSVGGTLASAFFISSSRFNVRQDGTISGSNVLFTGGKVGGWSIGSSQLSSGNVYLDSSTQQIWLGDTTYDNAEIAFSGSGVGKFGSVGINGVAGSLNGGTAFVDTFNGSVLDTELWYNNSSDAGEQARIVSGALRLENGNNAWDYAIVGKKSFSRANTPRVTFHTKVLITSESASPNDEPRMMMGFTDKTGSTSYLDNVHAIYFTNTNIAVYEGNTQRGSNLHSAVAIGDTYRITVEAMPAGGLGYIIYKNEDYTTPIASGSTGTNTTASLYPAIWTLPATSSMEFYSVTAYDSQTPGAFDIKGGGSLGLVSNDGSELLFTQGGFSLRSPNVDLTGNSIRIGNAFKFDGSNLTVSGSSARIVTPSFLLGGANQYVSGSNGNIAISSSNFFLDTAGNVTMAGTVRASAGKIGGFEITANAITGSGFLLSGSAIGDQFFISASNFNVKGNGNVTGSNVLFTGGKIAGFTISNDTLSNSNSFFISGSATGNQFFISSSAFNVKANGDVTASSALFSGSVSITGNVNARTGNIGGFAITADAITGSGFLLSGSATGDQFFISASNFNVKANGNVTGSNVLFTGGKIGSFTLSNDAFTAGTSFFISSSVGATPASAFFISSSRFNVRQDGTVSGSQVLFTGGKVGGLNIESNKMYIGTGTYGNTNTAFYVDSLGSMSLEDRFQWDGTNLLISGSNTRILTPSFFFGGATQYVSGSNGNIEISSSNFRLSRNGDVYVNGTITVDSLPQAPPAESLLAYYPLNSLNFIDASGNNIGTASYSGTPIIVSSSSAVAGPAVKASYVSPSLGNAIKFATGSDLYNALTTGQFTLCFWWQPQTITTLYGDLVSWKVNTTTAYGTTSNTSYRLELLTSSAQPPVGNGKLNLQFVANATGNGTTIYPPGVNYGTDYFTTGSNYHIAYVSDFANNTVKLYSNGVFVKSGSYTYGGVPTTALSAPSDGNLAFQIFGSNGVASHSLSELRVYTGSLTDTQIQSIYLGNAQLGGGQTVIDGNSIKTGQLQSTNWTTGGSVGSQFNLNNGTFKLGGDTAPKLSWDGTTLAVSGTVSANAGNIGGFNITTNAITGSGFYLSGSATGDQFFISASNFNVKANGNVTGSNVLFTGGRIASFTLSNDALTGGSTFFISSSVSGTPDSAFFISSSRFNIRQDGTISGSNVLFTGGKIGSFTLSNDAFSNASNFFISSSYNSANPSGSFFISSSRFNVRQDGTVSGSNVFFNGGRIGSFTLTNDALTAGSTFFISSSVGATPSTAFFISSSRFNVRQDGTVTGSNVLFNGGTIGGFTLSNTQLSSTNFLIDSSTGEIDLGATSYAAGDGVYMSKAAINNFRVGNANGARVQFTGTDLEIYNQSNTKLVSIGNTNTIAGFTLSNSTLSNGSNFFISGSSTGNGFFMSASSFNVKANGSLTASNASISGDITANTGRFDSVNIIGTIASGSVLGYAIEAWVTSSTVRDAVYSTGAQRLSITSNGTFRSGYLGWTGSAQLYNRSYSASLYTDIIYGRVGVSTPTYKKWGQLTDYTSGEYINFNNQNTIDVVSFPLIVSSSNQASVSITSNIINIPGTILSSTSIDGLTLQVPVLIHGDWASGQGGYRVELQILNSSNVLLGSSVQISSGGQHWMIFNVPLTPILVTIAGNGQLSVQTQFKVSIIWSRTTASTSGTSTLSTNIGELRIVKTSNIESIRAKSIVFDNSALVQDTYGLQVLGNLQPASASTYNIGSTFNPYDTIYANTFNGTATTASYTVSSSQAQSSLSNNGRYFGGGRLTINQSIPSRTDTIINFIDDIDPNGWINTAGNKRFTPTVGGYYSISLGVWFENPATGSQDQLNVQMRRNGNSLMIVQQPCNNGTGVSLTGNKIIYLNGSGDYVDFTAYNGTTSAKLIQSGTVDGSGTWFSAHLVSE